MEFHFMFTFPFFSYNHHKPWNVITDNQSQGNTQHSTAQGVMSKKSECSGNNSLVLDEKARLMACGQNKPIIVDTSQIKEKSFINYFESSNNGGITFADIQRDIDLHCLRQSSNGFTLLGTQTRVDDVTKQKEAEIPKSPNPREEAQRNWSNSFNREILSPCQKTFKNNSIRSKPVKLLFNQAPRGRGMMLAQHASRAGSA